MQHMTIFRSQISVLFLGILIALLAATACDGIGRTEVANNTEEDTRFDDVTPGDSSTGQDSVALDTRSPTDARGTDSTPYDQSVVEDIPPLCTDPTVFCGVNGETFTVGCQVSPETGSWVAPVSCEEFCRSGGPTFCAETVCGSDGSNYDCAWLAICEADVGVRYEGECRANGCVEDLDCDRSALCVEGLCWGAVCGALSAPACSDGETLGNRCLARTTQPLELSAGACLRPEDCEDNADCPSGEVCRLSERSCGPAQRQLDCDDFLLPVCGVDQMTYCDEAHAASNGIAETTPLACPCQATGQCPQPCNRDEDCGGGSLCIDFNCGPFVELSEAAAVCGLDGQTYAGHAAAHNAGTRVLWDHTCDDLSTVGSCAELPALVSALHEKISCASASECSETGSGLPYTCGQEILALPDHFAAARQALNDRFNALDCDNDWVCDDGLRPPFDQLTCADGVCVGLYQIEP